MESMAPHASPTTRVPFTQTPVTGGINTSTSPHRTGSTVPGLTVTGRNTHLYPDNCTRHAIHARMDLSKFSYPRLLMIISHSHRANSAIGIILHPKDTGKDIPNCLEWFPPCPEEFSLTFWVTSN